MSEYIEREALLKNAQTYSMEFGEYIGDDVRDVDAILVDRVKNVPAADVVPVVHGEWREDTDPADGDLRCTHCGIAWPKCVQKQIAEQGIWTLQTLFKYCPNCGAKMDAESEESQ